MDPETTVKLIELNRQFYQTFALQFSVTRQRLQPGVLRILEKLPPSTDILDLGSGNGELARELARRKHRGAYIGLDFSSQMLAQARQTRMPANFQLFQADLSLPDWEIVIPEGKFDLVLSFAVLHHLPGQELRLQVLQKIRLLIKEDGLFTHSVWQFLNSPRLRARIQPWQSVGIDETSLDQGDYLLDWRRGGPGFRYVHHFSEAELANLAKDADFTIRESYYSDGEGDRLALYQAWRLA